MLCNLVIKGTENEVNSIGELFCNEYGGDIEEQNDSGCSSTAWIYCPGIEREEVISKLQNVKWIGFIEDFKSGTLQVAISDKGSDTIDQLFTICDYDFHGDDRVASQYYPDSDFEAEFFWESAGECEIIDYECPCTEWWNKE